MDRVILHCDLNSFFASVECFYDPLLRPFPVAVAGDEEARHGIILAKNGLAKSAGVQTGEAIWQAKQKCPKLICVPAHYDRYVRHSLGARAIYCDYSDRVESFGMDECWIDLTGAVDGIDEGRRVADDIRRRIRSELGVTASVGVSFNKIFAKLGSDLKKPNATTVIPRDGFREKVWPLRAEEMIYVGPATVKRLHAWDINTLGDLAGADPAFLKKILGKNGVMLCNWANGLDATPVRTYEHEPLVKSVGNSMTAPSDIADIQTLKMLLYQLSESVAARLREYGLRCNTVQLSLRDTALRWRERQTRLPFSVQDSGTIFTEAFRMALEHDLSAFPLRSIGVRGTGLVSDGVVQTSLWDEYSQAERNEGLERTIDVLRGRFGEEILFRGLMLGDRKIAGEVPARDHTVHPESFFRR